LEGVDDQLSECETELYGSPSSLQQQEQTEGKGEGKGEEEEENS